MKKLDLTRVYYSPCCGARSFVQIVTDFRQGRVYEALTCGNCGEEVQEVYTGECLEEIELSWKQLELHHEHVQHIERGEIA